MAARLSRPGFTLVELLVTLGVIGLLLSLLLSGIQAARESARRAQCLNNIRQLALACHEFEAAHGTLPRTGSGYGPGHELYFLSPHIHLLPYLDQQPLYSSIDQNETSPGYPEPPASEKNPRALQTLVPLFVCPDDDLATGGATNYRACMGDGPGVVGQLPGQESRNGNGPWHHWRVARESEVSDGLSNTAIFGEKLTGDRDPSSYTPWRDTADVEGSLYTIPEVEAACGAVGTAPAKHRSYGGAAWLFGGFQATWYNHVLTPNSSTPDCGEAYGAFTARSFHTGGVNTALADGSSRFVANGIDTIVWRALATRRRGEVVTEF